MSSSAPPASSRDRLPGLDALRALAVIFVLGYHLFPGLAPGGFLGVDVFFVVSGYLITALLLHEHQKSGRIALRRFWSRRARRLLPALIVVVLVSASLAALIGGDVLVGIGWQLAGAATFTSNWVAVAAGSSYVDQTSPELLRHLWSLAVEEQFYLLFPFLLLLLLALPRRGMRVAALSALAVSSAVAFGLTAGNPAVDGGATASAAYLSTLTHGFGLVAGAALAVAVSPLGRVVMPAATAGTARRVRAVGASTALLVSLAGLITLSQTLSIDDPVTYRGGLAAAVLLTLLAIVALDRAGPLVAAAAGWGPVRWLGERSYSLYLWHWPLLILAVAILPDVDRSSAASWPLGAVVLVVSIALAAASYRWVEMPVRRLGVRETARRVGSALRASRPVTASLATIVTALLLSGTATAVLRAPALSEAAQLIEAGERVLTTATEPRTSISPSPTAAEAESTTPEVPPPPTPVTPEPEPSPVPTGEQLTAIGDSVMLAAAPALLEHFPGIDVDATVGRQMWSMPEVVADAVEQGALRDVIVIGVGANGDFRDDELTDVLHAVGDRRIVLVTAQAPRPWTAPANARLRAFAEAHRTVELADWEAVISGDLDLLASDQIHPGPTAGQMYAEEIDAALERLAAVPPLPPPPDPIDYDEHPELHRPL